MRRERYRATTGMATMEASRAANDIGARSAAAWVSVLRLSSARPGRTAACTAAAPIVASAVTWAEAVGVGAGEGGGSATGGGRGGTGDE